jgi:hypothetical protein
MHPTVEVPPARWLGDKKQLAIRRPLWLEDSLCAAAGDQLRIEQRATACLDDSMSGMQAVIRPG